MKYRKISVSLKIWIVIHNILIGKSEGRRPCEKSTCRLMCQWEYVFKRILNKKNVKMSTGFIWHQIGSSGTPVWRHYWNLRFHKRWGKSLEYLVNCWLLKDSVPRRWLPLTKFIHIAFEISAIEVNTFVTFMFIALYVDIYFQMKCILSGEIFTYFSICCTRTKYFLSVTYYSLTCSTPCLVGSIECN